MGGNASCEHLETSLPSRIWTLERNLDRRIRDIDDRLRKTHPKYEAAYQEDAKKMLERMKLYEVSQRRSRRKTHKRRTRKLKKKIT